MLRLIKHLKVEGADLTDEDFEECEKIIKGFARN